MPLKLQLQDANNVNQSTAGITMTAIVLTKQDSSAASALVEDAGNANPDSNFRYDATLGGYIYNLSTKKLTAGTWAMKFTVTGDPVPHTVTFDVR